MQIGLSLSIIHVGSTNIDRDVLPSLHTIYEEFVTHSDPDNVISEITLIINVIKRNKEGADSLETTSTVFVRQTSMILSECQHSIVLIVMSWMADHTRDDERLQKLST